MLRTDKNIHGVWSRGDVWGLDLPTKGGGKMCPSVGHHAVWLRALGGQPRSWMEAQS